MHIAYIPASIGRDLLAISQNLQVSMLSNMCWSSKNSCSNSNDTLTGVRKRRLYTPLRQTLISKSPHHLIAVHNASHSNWGDWLGWLGMSPSNARFQERNQNLYPLPQTCSDGRRTPTCERDHPQGLFNIWPGSFGKTERGRRVCMGAWHKREQCQ